MNPYMYCNRLSTEPCLFSTSVSTIRKIQQRRKTDITSVTSSNRFESCRRCSASCLCCGDRLSYACRRGKSSAGSNTMSRSRGRETCETSNPGVLETLTRMASHYLYRIRVPPSPLCTHSSLLCLAFPPRSPSPGPHRLTYECMYRPKKATVVETLGTVVPIRSRTGTPHSAAMQQRGSSSFLSYSLSAFVVETTTRSHLTMTELPHFYPAEPSPDRLWKRVRHIESNLGYSNLAFEGFPRGRDKAHGARNRQWQADSLEPPCHHRKRRMPREEVSARVQDSAPQRDLLNSRSVPTIATPSEKHSKPPWTRPVSQQDVGRGTLPRLPEPPQDSETKRGLEGTRDDNMSGNLGAAKMVGNRRHSEAMRQSSLSGDEGPGGGVFLGRRSKEIRLDFPVQTQTLAQRDFADDRVVDSGCAVRTPPCKVEELAEGAVGAAFDAQPSDAPSDLDTTPKVIESHQQRRFVVRTLPSGKKLRAGRAGRCRSLVSPNNKVFSSTVVARVKQGLQNRDNEERPKVLIVGSGTFNPIHKIHIRRFYLARNYLQVQKGMRVVGGILSPSHPTLVRQRHRVRAAEIIPPKHRLSMARAAVGEGSWLAVDPWEVTRKRIMDYTSVLEHAKEVCHETFPGHAGDITILYMCQASQIHHLNPAMLRAGGFGVITVCRPLEKASLLKELSPSFRNIAILVEDSTILSAEMERTSSHMVRHLLKQGKSVEGMVGKAVARYIRDNTIAERVSGRQKWTVEDNNFMFDQEDKEDRPYHNLPRLYMRRASQMPLQM